MLIQAVYWNGLFNAVIDWPLLQMLEDKLNKSLTILVCAQNDLENLKKLAPQLLNQNGDPKILIVNDQSTDETVQYLENLSNNSEQLNYLNSTKSIPGKKQALMDGLSNISEDFILLTDADCRVPKTWSEQMLLAVGDKDIVFGFSPYQRAKGFLNKWIRYEAILTGIQYLSFAIIGRPYMGVGRNILYRKALVEDGRVLKEHLNIPGGDDDLLINKLATSENVTINIHTESWAYSAPVKNWGAYIKQKRRHHSTSWYYKLKDKIALGIFSASWVGLFGVIFYLIYSGHIWQGLSLFLLRFLLTLVPCIKLFKKLDGGDLSRYWIFLDPLTAIYFLFFSLFMLLPKRKKW